MSTITLEEHFVTESFLRATGAHDRKTLPQLAELQSKLLDIGAGRIADMDKSGIDLQVLSLAAMGFDALDADTASQTKGAPRQVPTRATNSKPIPHIPLPFEEVMKDVLKVKPPTKLPKSKKKAM